MELGKCSSSSVKGVKLARSPLLGVGVGGQVGVKGRKNSSNVSPLTLKKEAEVKSMKCVLVGDSQVGKTSLVQTFLFDHFNKEYVPTARDDYTYCTTVKSQASKGRGQSTSGSRTIDVDLDICDTGGQSCLDRLRPLCYGKMDVAIICFSVVIPSSFASVGRKWIPELKRHCLNYDQGMKTILIGTQSDLRSNVNLLLQLMDDGLEPISEQRAIRLANKIGAVKYLECSSLNKYNLKKVFEVAMTMTVTAPLPIVRSSLLGSPWTLTGISDPKKKGQKSQTTAISERKEIFWRKWRLRQKSNKIKRLVFSCLY